jgi:hypothetical protein
MAVLEPDPNDNILTKLFCVLTVLGVLVWAACFYVGAI